VIDHTGEAVAVRSTRFAGNSTGLFRVSAPFVALEVAHANPRVGALPVLVKVNASKGTAPECWILAAAGPRASGAQPYI
jgi:hypothetical protein